MTAGSTLSRRCERLVNRCVAESTAARRAAEGLEGKSLVVEITGLELAVRATVESGAIGLELETSDASGPVDVRVCATPLELVRLARADSTDALKTARTRLEGDVHVAEAFAELARLARPDLEDELARWIGDIGAHEAAGLARGVTRFAARAWRALELDAADYLQQERELVPGRLEVDGFCADVDRLRDDVERAAARLERVAAAFDEGGR